MSAGLDVFEFVVSHPRSSCPWYWELVCCQRQQMQGSNDHIEPSDDRAWSIILSHAARKYAELSYLCRDFPIGSSFEVHFNLCLTPCVSRPPFVPLNGRTKTCLLPRCKEMKQ